MYNNRTNVPYIYIINQLEIFWHFFKIILLGGGSVRNIVMFFKNNIVYFDPSGRTSPNRSVFFQPGEKLE